MNLKGIIETVLKEKCKLSVNRVDNLNFEVGYLENQNILYIAGEDDIAFEYANSEAGDPVLVAVSFKSPYKGENIKLYISPETQECYKMVFDDELEIYLKGSIIDQISANLESLIC